MRLKPLALRLSTVLALGLFAAACGSNSSTSHQGSAHQSSMMTSGGSATVGALKISGAYIPDPATPSVAAAYFTVANSGAADRLTSVTASGFSSAMLNRYVKASDGAESMVPADAGAIIPAHGRLVLQPGGYHVMLMHPKGALHQGGTAKLTLRFTHAGTVSLTVPVVSDTGLPGDDSGGSMPGMDMSGSSG